ncbi:hypothetical protein [Leptospira weilii]|uniref:hypothetical protein n=1 Tax=Leptospira weilii TaxID=28184 RepID=UPI000C1FA751|nr:hypothetical protein [Leptospira weilii]QDK24016.1 hypothetical protein FHG67_15820 [Leptospira weilii]QDK27979.1 hypothetical protein FHG68_15870 [Leptospira weilii]
MSIKGDNNQTLQLFLLIYTYKVSKILRLNVEFVLKSTILCFIGIRNSIHSSLRPNLVGVPTDYVVLAVYTAFMRFFLSFRIVGVPTFEASSDLRKEMDRILIFRLF